MHESNRKIVFYLFSIIVITNQDQKESAEEKVSFYSLQVYNKGKPEQELRGRNL